MKPFYFINSLNDISVILSCLNHIALQLRWLLEAYGTGMNSENECIADPIQAYDVDST